MIRFISRLHPWYRGAFWFTLLFLGGCDLQQLIGNASSSILTTPPSPSPTLLCPPRDPFEEAVTKAMQAAQTTQKAKTIQEWNLGVLYWMQAIERMQAVTPENPKWLFAQKKVKEYQQNLTVTQQKANQVQPQRSFPSFQSDFLDEQFELFLSYRAALGTPDILIVGSSRAIQGIDPKQMQSALARQGQPNLKVFNFGINGATAQVVDLLVRELLTSEQLPRLIIWADGVRAFNSGRVDRTFEAIQASGGYQAVRKGDRPELVLPSPVYSHCSALKDWNFSSRLTWTPFPRFDAWAANLQNIDANGFLPEPRRFDPTRYYEQFPRVAGLYDGDYQGFSLTGVQATALNRLVAYTKQQNIPLVLVNLPLSQDYLDATRQGAENQFQAFMQEQAKTQGFLWIDLSRQWLQDSGYFGDPSHLNLYGASAIAKQLAENPQIPWPGKPQPPAPTPASPTGEKPNTQPSPQPSVKSEPSPSPSPAPTPQPEVTLPLPPE